MRPAMLFIKRILMLLIDDYYYLQFIVKFGSRILISSHLVTAVLQLGIQFVTKLHVIAFLIM